MCGALASVALPARADTPRIAAIDWAMLETAMALGIVPVAACELIRFRADAVTPELPPSVVDLGLRSAPNFALLQLTRPTLILSSPWYGYIEPRLSAIAPVFTQTFYFADKDPWQKSIEALHGLAMHLGIPETANQVEAAALAELAQMREVLAPFRDRPVYITQIGDPRHFRAFGADSMFGAVLTELGLTNAWEGNTEFSFAAPVPLERLASKPDARIIAVSDIPAVAEQGLRNSVLWNRLEPVAQGRFATIGNINPFGGLPAGLRFARLLTNALTQGHAG